MIYIRITLDGNRTEWSLQRQCIGNQWDPIKYRLKGKALEVKQFNDYLEDVRIRIYNLYNDLIKADSHFDGELIKAKFLGLNIEPSFNLLEIFTQHNVRFSQLVGKDYSFRTLQKYSTCKIYVEEFILKKYNASDLDIKKLNYEFVTDFEFFLKTSKGCAHNTVMHYIKKLKKVIHECVAKDWLAKDPFSGFRISIKETHRTYLSESELEAISQKNVLNERLSVVRDIFLFSCFTGLSFSDVEKLVVDNIVSGVDGKKWIHITRTKTNTASHIPLLHFPLSIIEKYSNHPKCLNSGKLLPLLSNQKMNSYLKELADSCQINKPLTFHCARHTFATTVTLTNGVPLETVSKILGHKSQKTTQHYGKIVDLKVSKDMEQLQTKLSTSISSK